MTTTPPSAAVAAQPEALQDFEIRKLAAIPAVDEGRLVERRPVAYRRELEDQFVRGFRAAESRLHAQVAALTAAPGVQAKLYSDGTTATGPGDLPPVSPNQQHAAKLIDCIEAMLGGANGPTIQLRGMFATPAQPAAPQGGAYAELPRVGAIGYASVVDIESYVKTLTIGPRLPGVRDVALWSTDQMRDFADATHALRASNGQAPAGARSADELARDLKNAIDTSLELRQQLRLMEEHVRGEVWRWQPEGSNELATMGNRMGVLIYASDLRNLISAAPTAQPAPAAQQPAPSAAAAEIAELLECSGCLKVGQKDRALAIVARLLPAQHGGVL